MKKHAITLMVNGEERDLIVPSNRSLLDALRDDLGYTDTKYGCGTGECGACTILVDGMTSINGCLTLAATMNGKSITTAAGLARNGHLHPVQEAFIENDAIQCGFCTPGMVLKTISLLDENPTPTEAEIRHGLEGNICRCTGYTKIVEAVQDASRRITGSNVSAIGE
ncbi:Aerobic carbon monoxide dehydrogenase (quinone), small chain [hydrothermal vent metagenome]|uniref:Aerobic carbon monoxide dehydrogenase (Quinone), small chain n=1 Tax=hydrothermal vent metagenome TaxID=652676 RepID=A0A3B1AZ94_9ZZZZ